MYGKGGKILSKTKKRTVGEYPAIPPQRVYVKNRWAYYLCAFMIPAILTFIAYMFFKVYPAGTRSVLTLDLNGQYVYYFEAIRDAFWGGRKDCKCGCFSGL